MIVLVTGGRDYKDWRTLVRVLDRLHREHGFTFLVHGDANGADQMAHRWAKLRGVQPVAMEALWDFEGDAAGTKRNRRMYDFAKPRLIVAFPGGRGTANMMKIGYEARKAGDPVEVIDVEDLT